MEGFSIMVLTIPIIFPMVVDLNFDPIWFGIIITLVMDMSLITPPGERSRLFGLEGSGDSIKMSLIDGSYMVGKRF